MTSDIKVALRPFQLTDAEEHLAGEDDEQVKWLSGGVSTLEGVKNWILRNQKYWEEEGPIFNFAITDKHNKTLLGMVEANSNYSDLEGLEKDDVNISYGLYPHARGKGYAIAAVLLMVDFLKEKGFRRAVIRVNPENKNSLQVPKRCGFSEHREIITKNGDTLKVFIKKLNDSNN